jgi:hypothetical protein
LLSKKKQVSPREHYEEAKAVLEHFSETVKDIEKQRVNLLCLAPEDSVFKCLEDSRASIQPVKRLVKDNKKADEALQKTLEVVSTKAHKRTTPKGIVSLRTGPSSAKPPLVGKDVKKYHAKVSLEGDMGVERESEKERERAGVGGSVLIIRIDTILARVVQ